MFKQYNQNQLQLLPPDLSDMIAKDHIARLISHAVDQMDITSIEKLYSMNGQHAYHPCLLLKVLIYGYASGIRSSRKLADKLNEDIIFMWLGGRQSPDFRTIADFRKEKLADFKSIFEQVLSTSMDIGLIRVGTISLDGSKILASASKNKMQYRKQILKRKINLKEKIDHIIKEADDLDAEEDRLYGSRTINTTGVVITKEKVAASIKKIQKRKQTLNKHKAIAKAQLSVIKQKQKTMRKDRNSYSSTDPDATLMLMKEDYIAPGYNIQIATEHQVILGYGVFSDRNDQKLLKPMIEEVEARTKKKPESVLADAGYGRKMNYRYLKNQKIAAYIPNQSYEKDTILRNQGLYQIKNPDTELERYKARMRIRLQSEEGQRMLRRRRQDVEPTFGDIKRNMEFRRFNLRGRLKCELELGLVSIAHNLKKIKTWVRKMTEWDDGRQKVQELGIVLGYLPA
ncbi:MAG: IS1182 family transposase [Chlamydiae bacterium]|nr:IS1182 family transposase [Chlamydiota bacterium]